MRDKQLKKMLIIHVGVVTGVVAVVALVLHFMVVASFEMVFEGVG